MRSIYWGVFFAVGIGVSVRAQSVVAFTPSTNHDTAVTRYDLSIEQGASIVRTRSLGKPTPDTGHQITVHDPSLFELLTAGTYSAVIVAIGPGGTARSGGVPFTVSTAAPTAPGDPIIITDPSSAPGPLEIVLYANEAANLRGRWGLAVDSSAGPGGALHLPDAGAAKLTSAFADPGDMLEFSFVAKAGVPYHVWVRMKADSDAWWNDSIFMQFNQLRSSTGAVIAPIGSTSGLSFSLEEGRHAGVKGWGWNDHAYGALAPHVYFAKDGTQVLRIQRREDGVKIDQIVISAAKYLNARPGLTKNDTTIVPK